MKYYILLVTIITCTLSTQLRANDGAAGLMGGDLQFKKLKGVHMLEEYLYLSFNQVRVRYVFKNKTRKAISTLISFPVKMVFDGSDLAYDSKSKNPLDFTVRVDGVNKKFKTKTQSSKTEKQLHHYWKQVFLPQKKVVIEHRYRPVFDQSVLFTMTNNGEINDDDWNSFFGTSLKKDFCASHKQIAAMRLKKLQYKELSYILTTAQTWDGPIGRFELVIDKGAKPSIFLCTDLAIKKIPGMKKFKAIARNYVPKHDLKIAFVGRYEE